MLFEAREMKLEVHIVLRRSRVELAQDPTAWTVKQLVCRQSNDADSS
jgi:hypothetical protein